MFEHFDSEIRELEQEDLEITLRAFGISDLNDNDNDDSDVEDSAPAAAA